MTDNIKQLPERLERMAGAIYIAVPEEVATDISLTLQQAATQLRATDQITKNLAEALEVITKECLLQGMSENAGMDCWILQAQDAIKAYKETL